VRSNRFSGDPQSIPDERWDAALRRQRVLERLSKLHGVSRQAAEAAGAELGVSARYVYKLLEGYRAGPHTVTSVMPRPGDGGRGALRLHPAVEEVIAEAIRKRYLSRQKLTVAVLHRMISDECVGLKLPPPGANTVARRVRLVSPLLAAKRRGGDSAARRLTPVAHASYVLPGPLQRVEMDHTWADIMIVDQLDRLEIGRPYVTIAIDKGGKGIAGMVVTLEPPSRLSVALCLAHMASDKRNFLERVGVNADVEWPMAGKPVELFLDNASEFHSKDLARGCEQHGIRLGFRRPWKPDDGPVVERFIGTLMKRVHELSGTTFSNVAERGDYPSQKFAEMTLPELEKWLVLAIAEYHGTVHGSLRRTPAAEWARTVTKYGQPPLVTDPALFMLDFLPSEWRSIGRKGFVWDDVHYYSPALNPWIERRDHLPKFRVVRDPRDMSQIWVEVPPHEGYLMIPSASLIQQPISVWEFKAIKARQLAEGRAGEDGDALIKLRADRLEIQAEAAKATRRTRRNAERVRSGPLRPPKPLSAVAPPPDEEVRPPQRGFDEFEEHL
jgi:putative transposase